jgi:hypothetical protein
MPPTIAALMLALGCAPASFSGPAGDFAIWVCPPVVDQQAPSGQQSAPPPPPVPEREA